LAEVIISKIEQNNQELIMGFWILFSTNYTFPSIWCFHQIVIIPIVLV